MRRSATFAIGLSLAIVLCPQLLIARQVKEAVKAAPVQEVKEAAKEVKEATKAVKDAATEVLPKKAVLPGLGGLFGKGKEAVVSESFNQEKADSDLMKSIQVESSGPALLDMIRKRTLDADSRSRLLKLVAQLGDDSFTVREQASHEIEGYGPIAVPVIRQSEREGDPEVIRRCIRLLEKLDKVPTRGVIAAACRLLAKFKPDGSVPVLLGYLPLAEDEGVLTEIRNTLQVLHLKDGKPDSDLTKASEATDTLMRGTVLEIFSKSTDAALREQMKQKALQEKDLDIRLRMILALIQVGKDKSLLPEMIRLMGEVPMDKGWRAEEMLCRLAGDKSPSVALGTDVESRQKASKAWEKWWKENGKDVNLARLDEIERMLGYTMCVELDAQNFMGRVVEYGPDRKERWSIKDLNYPTDAIIMPGEKVMIAEQNTGTISLRDIKTGKVDWSEQMQAMSLSRLPNGHIVVGCRNQIVEWELTPTQRKVVWQLDRNNFHDVASAGKLPNGNYIFLSTNGANSSLQIVDKDKKLAKPIPVSRAYYFGSMHILSNSRVMVTLQNGISEIDLESGKSVWNIAGRMANSVQKLPTGNVLVAFNSQSKVAELDREGKETWKLSSENGFRPWRAKRR